jgi:hypothetical protein
VNETEDKLAKLSQKILEMKAALSAVYAERRYLMRSRVVKYPPPLSRGDVDPATGLVVGSPEYDQHLLEHNK